jgi:hypothetical protein
MVQTLVQSHHTIAEYQGDEQIRSLLKMITLIAINAKDEPAALKAIKKKINFNPKDWRWIKDRDLNMDDLINQFKLIHPSITLFSGVGVMLQSVDALIVERVVNQFTEDSIPILSIHDSFIVEEEYESLLKDRMINAFKDVMKIIGVDIGITIIIK